MKVKLFATLMEKHGKVAEVSWYEGMTGYTLFKDLDIAEEHVSIFLINGLNSAPDTLIKEDDTVALFPPLGGG